MTRHHLSGAVQAGIGIAAVVAWLVLLGEAYCWVKGWLL